MFRKAQVVVVECNWRNPFSRLIASSTNSPVTHSWMVTGENRAVEAAFPRVRPFVISEKLAELHVHDQAYIALDMKMGIMSRARVAAKAESYIGRFYDVGQALLYGLTHKFWNDGTGTLVCSRLVTASYLTGAGIDLFPEDVLAKHYDANSPRLPNLREGYATPADLLRSRLEVVGFHSSQRYKRPEDFFLTL